jgi:hypothetical protein
MALKYTNMDIENLKLHTRKFIKDFPQYREEFVDYYELALSEIEEGGSEDHECDMAYNSMLDIVQDTLNNPAQDALKEEEQSWTRNKNNLG